MINTVMGLFIGLFIGILIMSLMKISTINDLQEEIEKTKHEKNWISWLDGVHYEREYWTFKVKEKIEEFDNIIKECGKVHRHTLIEASIVKNEFEKLLQKEKK